MRLSAGNPMARPLSVILILEAIVFGLAIPGMVMVSGHPLLQASLAAGGAAVLALAASATIRRGPGYLLGWLTQVAAIALGFGTTYMFGMGGIFALLYVATFVLGRRLEAR